MSTHPGDRFTRTALGFGVIVPVAYFGIQLVAAVFYPGYSFLNQDASTLGSVGSRCPAVFNIGAIIVGILALIATWGFMRALRLRGTNSFLVWLTVLSLTSFGLGSINAGLFPLPDPRHTEKVTRRRQSPTKTTLFPRHADGDMTVGATCLEPMLWAPRSCKPLCQDFENYIGVPI